MPHDISYRHISNEDIPFLRYLYAGSRYKELSITGWDKEQINAFLFSQFSTQHHQYMENYKNANFDIIILNKTKDIGRLYIDRRKKEIRIIDIIISPPYQKRGIATQIFANLIREAENKKVVLSLHVEHNNPAMKLYEKFGFTKKDDRGVYLYMVREPSPQKNPTTQG